MKPVVFIAAGILLLGGVVLHNSGYFDAADPFAGAAKTDAQVNGADSVALADTPKPAADSSSSPARRPFADTSAAKDAPDAEAPTAAQGTAASVVAPPPSGPKVDETALRYFATKGDTKRLEAEIARLRALYPQWTPPDNPLAVRQQGDPQLDQMWKLYSEGKLAEVRKAIADRQTAESGWQVPADLLDRLAVAEAREQLVNASDLKQYDAVIRIGASNSSLLTCGDVDVLWRVAEAFARTDRSERARDAYLYVLKNCDKTEERVATVQKAIPLLKRDAIDQLLATERTTPDGKGEFAGVRIDIVRQSLADADADPKLVVPRADVAAVEKLAGDDGLVSDYLLLGWYYVRRDNPKAAEDWFSKARDKENTADASQGLALALVNQNRPIEAEDILYEWRGTSDDIRKVYLAAVANLLAITPPPILTTDVLQRMVQEVVADKDPASAQQLGWYADGLNQFQTAAQWFKLVLQWKPDDEPSAYGLALMRWKLGDQAGVREVQAAWAGRSDRIPTVGEPSIETSAVGTQTTRVLQQPRQPALQQYQSTDQPQQVQPQIQQVQPQQVQPTQQDQAAAPSQYYDPSPRQQATAAPRASAKGSARQSRGCSTSIDPGSLSPEAALTRGWCLMEANRPIEAAAAFEVALAGTGKTRADAAYGQSLAYLRAGLSDMAAVSASKAPLDGDRGVQLKTALLDAQATTSFEQGRYVETLMALDERAQVAAERTDLMVLRGYAYLRLRRYADAEQVFRAAAATGNHDALKGLHDVVAERDARSQ